MSSASKSSKSTQREKPQYSTAISDAILAFLTLYAASLLINSGAGNLRVGGRAAVVGSWQQVAAASIALTGVAAAIGTIRFAGVTAVKQAHEFVAGLAMFVTMPILGLVGILAYVNLPPQSPFPLFVFVFLLVAFFAFRRYPRRLHSYQEQYLLITGLFGVMCVFFRSIFILLGKSGTSSSEAISAGWSGVVGTSLVLLAATVTTTGTRKFGPIAMLNVDIFHYLMAAANICLVQLFQGMWY